MTDFGQLASGHLAKLAQFSEGGEGVTRFPFTRQHRSALDYLTKLMQEAGLAVHLDDAGTLVGRYEGGATQTFYMGSHQDSLCNGGAYDGIMGVVLPILALQKLKEYGVGLPYSVEIFAFADEEGVRFPTALIGSRAIAGSYDPAVLTLQDSDGVSIEEAMKAFGLEPAKIPQIARDKKDALGYLEIHIEQGPVLEEECEAVGVVEAICGIERHSIQIIGETGHAGTLPMYSRQDALVAASQLVFDVNIYANSNKDVRATIGHLTVQPNVASAVPGLVNLIVEIRSPDDRLRENMCAWLYTYCQVNAEKNNVLITADRTYVQPAEPCDKDLTSVLQRAVKTCGSKGVKLPSGATHDASAMADLCPISMLFVRCKDGISHNPKEFASADDMGQAVEVIAEFLQLNSP